MKDSDFAKAVVFINGAVPVALLAWDAYWHHLGVNPVEYAIRTTGMLALVFLILSLAVTPLRKLTGSNYFSHFRRMLGLFAFFYGCLHLSTYFVLDRSLNLSNTIEDVLKRRFIFFGMSAWLLMVPLAITSTNGMIKRLGAKKWKRLHQLVYLSAILGVVHYYSLVKADVRQPVAFGIVLAALLLYRPLADKLPSFKAKHAPRVAKP